MKWNLFLFSFKIYLVKYAIPKFETSGVKSNDFTSLQSWAILPSKMVFESCGQNTTWHQPLTSLWCQNRSHRRRGNRKGDIVLLVPQTSKVAKTQHLRWVYECISSPQNRLFERNGPRQCPKTLTRLQGSDIKIRFAMFGTFWRVVLWAKLVHFE